MTRLACFAVALLLSCATTGRCSHDNIGTASAIGPVTKAYPAALEGKWRFRCVNYKYESGTIGAGGGDEARTLLAVGDGTAKGFWRGTLIGSAGSRTVFSGTNDYGRCVYWEGRYDFEGKWLYISFKACNFPGDSPKFGGRMGKFLGVTYSFERIKPR
jgi:hypothetical protein